MPMESENSRSTRQRSRPKFTRHIALPAPQLQPNVIRLANTLWLSRPHRRILGPLTLFPPSLPPQKGSHIPIPSKQGAAGTYYHLQGPSTWPKAIMNDYVEMKVIVEYDAAAVACVE
ncbi:hypothetical protein GYMLUDRAFT_247743 [Collybiopsis luxurians FD-317 M1]|uniref:Uncharacterized protein n=1 Tax=Collybiopsis luxurians FD-317 M1 TaxID=944289 RepID=A0A0D0BNE5_9AGAR|nr:hypothetical protein GYMLUDRAFT_247743 [Collybiopsis luxurians FD-317 M1]